MSVQVFIPTYNRCAKLRRAIASVLAQGHRDLEVVVLDNHSEDGTAAMLAELQAADRRVTWIRHDRNIGMVPNFNAIGPRVTADYFAVLTDDDEYEPCFVETALACFAKDPRIGFVACSAPTRIHGVVVKNQIDAWPEGFVRRNTTVFRCLSGQYPLVTNCLFKREVAPDFVFHEDLGNTGDAMLLTCAFAKYDAWISKVVTGYWNNDHENASTVNPADASLEVDRAIFQARHYRDFCRANGIAARGRLLLWLKRYLLALVAADKTGFAQVLATTRVREAFSAPAIASMRLAHALRLVRGVTRALAAYRRAHRAWIAWRES